ncbi:MAG: hypothetical protein FJW20_09330 [Acidimicrobiia bacterium]|nr:hypothetical protein [Acidimicrobiia bacterium]
MNFLYYFIIPIGLILHILILRGILTATAYRIYPFLFAYCVVDFLSSVVEASAFLGLIRWQTVSRERFVYFYWANEFLLQLLIFTVMVSLIHKALEHPKARRFLVGFIVVLVLTASVASLAYTYSAKSGERVWITDLSGKLSFFSAMLNVILWTALIRGSRRNSRLLVIAAGLGVLTTGKSIGHHVRGLSAAAVPYANLFIVLSHLVCLFAWWWAFYRIPDSSGSASGANPRGQRAVAGH